MGVNATRVRGEQCEELEFLGGQGDRRSGEVDAVAGAIDTEVADLRRRVGAGGRAIAVVAQCDA